LSPRYCKRARSTRNEARQVKRGGYGRMRQPADIRPFGGRSFMGAGNKTTFMTNDRPKGRPHAPTHLPKSLTAGCPAGLSIASWGGVRGGFR
jgi:hypothetical protein